MVENFIQKIKIDKVRHLSDIEITLSDSERKHLILTGKNGSGKTSVLESIKLFLSMNFENEKEHLTNRRLMQYKEAAISAGVVDEKRRDVLNDFAMKENDLEFETGGVRLQLLSESEAYKEYVCGRFILASYGADREYKAYEAKYIEKVNLKQKYDMDDTPSKELVKFLLALKASQALSEKAKQFEKTEKSQEIDDWFEMFESLLRTLFDDELLKLHFDIETFEFTIITKDRLPFGFNQMSSGYSAVLDIVVDLILRMEHSAKGFYDLQGIVLIDEIETHLHLDLQKKIFPFLTKFFPKLQFIITTHSPFVLNSADNAVIYDLENRIEVAEGLQNLTYTGVVEGYFEVELLSEELKRKFDRYKNLFRKKTLESQDYAELAELENYLDEVPDYLDASFSSEYSRMRLEFIDRGE